MNRQAGSLQEQQAPPGEREMPQAAWWQQPSAAALHNLPAPLTRFIGREKELQQLHRLLHTERLVSLLGPGGVGKTRLALHTAWQRLPPAVDAFPDGVCFVPLKAAHTAEVLLFALAEALQLPPLGQVDLKMQLINFLAGWRMLLILDNFEHLVEYAGLLTEILERAAGVKMLVTSRRRLNLYAESILEVRGLQLPEGDNPAALEASDAAQLFVYSAQRVRPDFELNAGNRPDVLRICRLVDGLPLALELAGSWARRLECAEIAAQVEQDLGFLSADWQEAPDRRQRLQTLLEQTWQMLSPAEQDILGRLACLQGRFDRRTAGCLAGANLPTLAALADRSLLEGGAPWYRLHPLLQRFAWERLAQDPAALAGVRRQHCACFMDFLRQRAERLRGKQMNQALREIGEVIDDIRYAWEWATSPSDGAPLIEQIEAGLDGLYRFYETRARYQDGETALSSALHALETVDSPAARLLDARLRLRRAVFWQRLGRLEAAQEDLQAGLAVLHAESRPGEFARAVFQQADLALEQGRRAEAQTGFEQALEIARRGQRAADLLCAWVEADSLGGLAHVQLAHSRFDEALALADQAIQAHRGVEDRRGEASDLYCAGKAHLLKGEYPQAVKAAQAALAIFNEMGHILGASRQLDVIGGAYLYQGRYAEAWRCQEEALHVKRQIGDRLQTGQSLNNLGFTGLLLGDFERAASCFEEALLIARELNRRPVQATILTNLALLRYWEAQNSVGGQGLAPLPPPQTSPLEQARQDAEQALYIAQETGGRLEQSQAQMTLGHILCALGELPAAQAAYRQAYDLHIEMDIPAAALEAQAGLAQAALALGDLAQAQQLAAAVWPAIHSRPPQGADLPFQMYLACWQVFIAAADRRAAEALQTAQRFLLERAARINDEAQRRSFLENIPPHRAILQAAGPETTAPVSASTPTPLAGPLTRQEHEILRLLAGGLTNQQIAEKLVISVGTVKFHVHNLYRKLEAQNRTQAVARGRECGLF